MDGTTRIDELEQKFIENPRRYFAPLANEYRKAGNPHQAIAICRAHLGQLPGHMSGQIVYGQALFEGGEYEQARTVFENALAMDRENLVALRHLGDLALREGETGAARQWYGKVLEIDPQDPSVVALVNEIDAAARAVIEPVAGEQPPAPGSEVAPAISEAVHVEPDAGDLASDDEDALMAEELGYPLPPPQAFVTETMAELYLAQGFKDRALGVYRELLSIRPEDERVRARLTELEEAAAEPVVARREDPPSIESPDTQPDTDRAPSIEVPAPGAPDALPPSEESPDGGTAPIDSPPSERRPAEDDSIESPGRDDQRAEPEGIAAPLESPARDEPLAEPEGIAAQLESPARDEPLTEPERASAELTVREFFAGLGRRRPTSRANGSRPTDGPYAHASADIFSAEPASESDARAAGVLAGAFAAHPLDTLHGGPAPAKARSAPGKESEEDVATFRAWLDGLTSE